jgi:membrane protease YdiL (CAAX protease family)
MGNNPVGDHEKEEKEITKSPTDAFVEHAKEESAEFRDFMVRYLPFTIIGYLLILLLFSAIFTPLMAFLLWIATGFGIYKIAENYGEDVPWIKQVLENVQNIGFTSTSPDTAPEAIVAGVDEPEEEKAADLDNYAEKFDEWRVTKDTIAPTFVSAGEKITSFSFNTPGLYKVRLWLFLILVPLFIWIVFWDLVTWPFYVWYKLLGLSEFQSYNLSSVSGLFLSFFIIIRIYSHCTNNRTLPINSEVLSDYDNYVVQHLFILPKKGSLSVTAKGMLLDFLAGWFFLVWLYGFDGFDNISCIGVTAVGGLESFDYFSLFTLMLYVAVLTPIIEELLFRGFVLDLASEVYGRWGAIVISSILFAIVHVEPVSIINAFIGGLIYGYVRIRTDSLWPSIFLHSVWNAHLYLLIVFCS